VIEAKEIAGKVTPMTPPENGQCSHRVSNSSRQFAESIKVEENFTPQEKAIREKLTQT
jgi:hypothetical protein